MSSSNVPESRVYRHLQCNSETTISGQPFEVMSNPISDMTRTWCTQCNAHFPISDYVWADTNENIVDYYARHGAKATSLQRFLCSKRMMIILGGTGLVLGAIGGFMLFRNGGMGQKLIMVPFCGGVGGFIGLAIYVSLLCEPIKRRVCGVKDTRTLV